ncbi:MAG: hypothetical protein HYY26_00390 [Acidobacteria bacterium]|nr:hypothetical protein [Acidobacteriota bacterium]
MKLLLGVLGGALLVLLGAAAYGVYRLRRWARSSRSAEWMSSFEGDLAIPMRDCDTTRTRRKP